MKKYFLILTLCAFTINSFAEELLSFDEVSLGVGESKDHIHIYRLGGKNNFESIWFKSDYGRLSGYYEASIHYWEKGNDQIYGVAFSPVFVYYLGGMSDTFQPYVEAGIGVAYISKTKINGRNMATHFQFEDRIGLGIKTGSYDFNARYMHYSNAGIEKPNNGIDIIMFTLAYKF
ncbi:MAG: acyloxyacyl hydrolase [Sulfurovum sp.]|nr:MAG: acyloxyacyl hydrolase [Sulfurovum sp.]